MEKVKKIMLSLWVSVFYGLLTLGFAFFLLPKWLLPDLIWYTLLVGVPAVAVIPLIRATWYRSPFFIFAGIPVQYLALYVHAQFFAYRIGALSLTAKPGLRYFFVAVTWPILFALIQFLVIYVARKMIKRRNRNGAEGR